MSIRKEFQNCKRWVLIVIWVLAALPSLAADVKLRNGEVLKDVTITGVDSKHIYVQTAYGKITYPIETLESIDGKPVRTATPTPRPTPLSTATLPFDSVPAAPPVAPSCSNPAWNSRSDAESRCHACSDANRDGMAAL